MRTRARQDGMSVTLPDHFFRLRDNGGFSGASWALDGVLVGPPPP